MMMIPQESIAYTNRCRALNGTGRTDFLNAVRQYPGNVTKDNRVRIIAEIVRNSRNVFDDDGVLPDDVRGILVEISRRYSFGGVTGQRQTPVSFRDARVLVEELFF